MIRDYGDYAFPETIVSVIHEKVAADTDFTPGCLYVAIPMHVFIIKSLLVQSQVLQQLT